MLWLLGILSIDHQEKAMPLHKLIVIVFGFLAFICILGGAVGIFSNVPADTQVKFIGIQLTTKNVGVAFVGIGMIIAFLTIRSVLKNQKDLAALPRDGSKEGDKPAIAPAAPENDQV